MTVSDGIHLLHQDSHSCVIDGYDKLVWAVCIPQVRTIFQQILGAFFALVSSANFLHVHSTKHVWCVTMDAPYDVQG